MRRKADHVPPEVAGSESGSHAPLAIRHIPSAFHQPPTTSQPSHLTAKPVHLCQGLRARQAHTGSPYINMVHCTSFCLRSSVFPGQIAALPATLLHLTVWKIATTSVHCVSKLMSPFKMLYVTKHKRYGGPGPSYTEILTSWFPYTRYPNYAEVDNFLWS